MNNDAYRVSD